MNVRTRSKSVLGVLRGTQVSMSDCIFALDSDTELP